MRNTCSLGLCLLALVAIADYAFAQSTNATTDDGRAVTLFDDGTWKYKEKSEKPTAKGEHFRPADSTAFVESKKGFVKLWYNPNKWKVKATRSNASSEFEFEHEKGDAYAIVIIERMSMTSDALRGVVVTNWQSADKNAKVVLEEQRSVNGIRVLVLQAEVTASGIPFKFYGYYWSDKPGTFQIALYTSENLFDEFVDDFTDFLDGVETTKK